MIITSNNPSMHANMTMEDTVSNNSKFAITPMDGSAISINDTKNHIIKSAEFSEDIPVTNLPMFLRNMSKH